MLANYFLFFLPSTLLTVAIIFFLYRRGKNINALDVNSEEYVKRKKFFTYEITLTVLAGLTSLLSFFFIAKKIEDYFHFDPQHQIKTPTDSILYHFDFTGILIGIVGILIGVLIFVVVENNNEQNNKEIKEHLTTIHQASENIQTANLHVEQVIPELQKAIGDVKMHLSALKLIESLKERLRVIEQVILHARDKNNDLYVLTYAPNYGQYLMTNLKVIVDESGISEALDGISHKRFFNSFMQPLFQLKSNIKKAISAYLEKSDRLHMAILRNSFIDASNPDRFRQFIKERVMKDKKVLLINPVKDHEYLPAFATEDLQKTFLHTVEVLKDFAKFDEKEKAGLMIDFLCKRDEKLFDTIQDKLRIESLDNIPFQFFLSVPKNARKNEGYGIVIFTNYYNIGQDNSVISFATESEVLISGLKKMYEELIIAQKKKDEDISDFKKIFTTHPGYKIKLVLKNINLREPQDEFPTYREVTPVADSRAKDQLLALLKEYDVKYTSDVEFIKANKVATLLPEQASLKNTLVSLGLFHNALSERIGQHDAVASKSLFQLKKSVKNNDGVVPKKIQVAIAGNINDKEPLSYNEFDEVYSNSKVEAAIRFDYAIVSKQKINGKWIFACGGINFFASENIVKCLSRDNCSEVMKYCMSDQSFAAVFKVYDDEKISTELVLLSVVQQDGTIVKKI